MVSGDVCYTRTWRSVLAVREHTEGIIEPEMLCADITSCCRLLVFLCLGTLTFVPFNE